jgi:1-deoxy-D-xylulose-5-phosphate reductoisomerase
VDAFHDGQIGFVDIGDTVSRVVDEHQGSVSAGLSVEEVMRADAWARSRARKVLGLPDMDAATRVAGTAGHEIASGGAS